MEFLVGSDPTSLVMFVGSLDIREIPVLADVQHAASIVGHGDSWMSLPWKEGLVASPLILRFGVASASASFSNQVSVDAMGALAQFRVVPGKHVSLLIGDERREEVFTQVAGVGSTSQFTTAFHTLTDGLTINADVTRRVGGVILGGIVEQSKFNFDGSKKQRKFEGVIDIDIGKWEPLVIFGSADVSAPRWSFTAQGFAVWVRADYPD